MSTLNGTYFFPSPFRRLVIDLLHFSTQVPVATIERLMPLESLIAARKSADNPPTWSAIFTKAFAIVANKMPVLRTTFLNFPVGRYYLHPESIATVNVSREINGEAAIVLATIPSPNKLPIAEIDIMIRGYQNNPVESIPAFQNAMRLTSIPWPFRRLVWWSALNLSGPIRCCNFGTFGLSSLGSQGAGITHLAPIQTTQLHYGMITPEGILPMRLSFDHRVLDGMLASKALAELEITLQEMMVDECQTLPKRTTGDHATGDLEEENFDPAGAHSEDFHRAMQSIHDSDSAESKHRSYTDAPKPTSHWPATASATIV